ncbi:MAG: DUF4428 domain-containing protein [Clostridiales bacterium]|nr:DUF4428 domain-containing protein [Clostridiales bacterium]
MGLFDKKICSICGGEIGLLGNRKLEDGNMCKKCASKLSPFLSDRRGSTVAEIREHLSWREKNQIELLGAQPTRVFGSNPKVYVDEKLGKFFITYASNWRNDNPDLIPIARVLNVTPDIVEHSHELYHHDREGKQVPFNPRRYEYEYQFNVTIQVDMPWYSQIKFELTGPRPRKYPSPEYREWEAQMNELIQVLTTPPVVQTVQRAVVSDPAAATADETWTCACGAVNAGRFCVSCGKPRPEEKAVETAADTWKCECGQVSSGKFCPNCGKPRPVKPKVYRCDKCGWTPDDPTDPPRFCPNCGDRFTDEDEA